MLFNDSYKTIKSPGEGIYNISGSRFIGFAVPLVNEAAIKTELAKVKELHPSASHYCWAASLMADQSAKRFNDDGEPAGAAGRPILNVIQSQQLNNILVVVVRYFGGTLLGIPGLISAYKTAAIAALNNTVIVSDVMRDYYEIQCSYPQLNEVMKLMRENELPVKDKLIDNTCTVELGIPKQKVEILLARFNSLGIKSVKYLNTY